MDDPDRATRPPAAAARRLGFVSMSVGAAGAMLRARAFAAIEPQLVDQRRGPGWPRQQRRSAPRRQGRRSGAAATPNRERPPEPKRYKAEQGRAARFLPADAAHPPLRGARRPALRARPDRRLLPPLYRPGGGRGRPAVGARGRQGQRHHRLSRPWPHARLRHRSQGDHGRADRPRRRHLQGQGRLDAHVQRRARLLRRPRHRRRPGQPRHRPRLQAQICAATAASASLISATARPIRARSTRASTWPSCGSCRSSS